MILRGIDFGPCWGASGVQGWYGEGYPYHRWLGPLGPNFHGMTFVAKTTTLYPRSGNMPLDEHTWAPKEWLPKCVVVKPFAGAVLNAVGLSGPGAAALLTAKTERRWQNRENPFFISFMSVAPKPQDRLDEVRIFTDLLSGHLDEFRSPFGLQVNFSCPNVGLDPSSLIDETIKALDILEKLAIPLVPKFNVLMPVTAALRVAEHPACDAICMSNTLPFGKLPERINWSKLFGAEISPLASMGGGGLSGAPLHQIVVEWVKEARDAGLDTPLNVGGGIMSPRDVDNLVAAGLDFSHDSIFLGSVAMLRPWRVAKIVRHANRLAQKKDR